MLRGYNTAMRIIVYVAGIAIAIGVAAFMVGAFGSGPPTGEVTTFDECVAAGNPIVESYPRQCRSADGLLFIENVAGHEASGNPQGIR